MIVRVAAVPVDGQLLRRREGEVPTNGILALFVERQHALVVVEATGEEVAHAVRRAAVHRQVVIALYSVPQPWVHVQVLGAIALAHCRAATTARRVGWIRRVEAKWTHAIEALAGLEIPARCTDRAALRLRLRSLRRRLAVHPGLHVIALHLGFDFVPLAGTLETFRCLLDEDDAACRPILVVGADLRFEAALPRFRAAVRGG